MGGNGLENYIEIQFSQFSVRDRYINGTETSTVVENMFGK